MVEQEVLPVFDEKNLIYEEVSGLFIGPDGSWNMRHAFDVDSVIKNFMLLELSVSNLQVLISGKSNVEVQDGDMMVSKDNTQSFDSTGVVPKKLYECPNCHKKVEKILANGYCSKTCAMKAKAERSKQKINAAGEKTLEIINEVQDKLKLLDLALNIVTMIPQILKDSVKLPQEYREYVIIRIEILFLKMKKIINKIEIARNEKIMELMKKIKFGSIDEKLSVILAPINAVISTIVALQQALNTAIASIMAMLQNPVFGAIGPNGGHGFLMTAKSFQHPLTSGKIFVEIKPTVNAVFPMPAIINVIDVEKIDKIIETALPPIQEIEYFLEPTAFKVRFAFSKDNAPKVKMMIDLLEMITVQCMGECFPRYKHLQLWRVFFVLAILTGWGPTSRTIFGDFIFHAPI